MKKRKEVQMMVKRIIVLLIALLALCSMAFALPAGIDNSANLVQIAGLGPDKLEGTSLAELKWFVDKTTMQSNLTGDKQRSTGYEATVTLVAMAKMNDGKISLLSEKWYIKTGGKEEGLFRGITNRITLFEGKEEVLKDVPVSKVAPKSQDEMIAQYIMLYDTERVNRLARAEAEAKAKGQSPVQAQDKTPVPAQTPAKK
jgi:hypothetical protein